MVHTPCLACGSVVSVGDAFVGAWIFCPTCGTRLEIAKPVQQQASPMAVIVRPSGSGPMPEPAHAPEPGPVARLAPAPEPMRRVESYRPPPEQLALPPRLVEPDPPINWGAVSSTHSYQYDDEPARRLPAGMIGAAIVMGAVLIVAIAFVVLLAASTSGKSETAKAPAVAKAQGAGFIEPPLQGGLMRGNRDGGALEGPAPQLRKQELKFDDRIDQLLKNPFWEGAGRTDIGALLGAMDAAGPSEWIIGSRGKFLCVDKAQVEAFNEVVPLNKQGHRVRTAGQQQEVDRRYQARVDALGSRRVTISLANKGAGGQQFDRDDYLDMLTQAVERAAVAVPPPVAVKPPPALAPPPELAPKADGREVKAPPTELEKSLAALAGHPWWRGVTPEKHQKLDAVVDKISKSEPALWIVSQKGDCRRSAVPNEKLYVNPSTRGEVLELLKEEAREADFGPFVVVYVSESLGRRFRQEEVVTRLKLLIDAEYKQKGK